MTTSATSVTTTLYAQAAVVPIATSVSMLRGPVPCGPPGRAVEAARRPRPGRTWPGTMREPVELVHREASAGANIRTMIAEGDRDRDHGLDEQQARLPCARDVVGRALVGQRRGDRAAVGGRARPDVIAGGLDRADQVRAGGDVGAGRGSSRARWRG